MASSINASTAGAGGVITTADNSGVLNIQTAGTTALTISAAQASTFAGTVAATALIPSGSSAPTNGVYLPAANSVGIATNSTERLRVDSNGILSVGTTNTGGQIAVLGLSTVALDVRTNSSADVIYIQANTVGSASTASYIMPIRTGSTSTFQGGIQWTGSVIAYNVSSDYRLKEDVAPMVGALDSVLKLKPVTYTWKSNGAFDNGFIAHELQEVLPSAVSGEKDAFFKDGSMNPQCVDYSKLVATLTSAIQELNAKVDAQAAEIAALKAGA